MGWRPLLNKESSLPLQAKNNSNKESAEWGRWTKRVPRQGQMSQKNKIPIATCHCWRGTYSRRKFYYRKWSTSSTLLHVTRARTGDGSTKTNPHFSLQPLSTARSSSERFVITWTFLECDSAINKNEPSFHRHVYFELNGCVDGLAKRGQERPRAWNSMIN